MGKSFDEAYQAVTFAAFYSFEVSIGTLICRSVDEVLLLVLFLANDFDFLIRTLCNKIVCAPNKALLVHLKYVNDTQKETFRKCILRKHVYYYLQFWRFLIAANKYVL